MDAHARKAAIAAYKERPPAWGVYAVICNATGETWVGSSRHVDTERNGLWFSLRLGSGRCLSLQTAWSLHGEEAFRFEELDRLREDQPALTRSDELKHRSSLWRHRLQAEPI